MKKLKILAVCGFGVGSSMLLKMNIDDVMQAQGIRAEVETADIMTASSVNADLIFTSKELYGQLKDKVTIPLIEILNFMDHKEIEEKGMPIIREILGQ
jgi:PTS system ascorbate-specific IIB component